MYLHPASALDISIADPALVDKFTWTVHDDQYGSDHFPTLVNCVNPSNEVPIKRWKCYMADWVYVRSLYSIILIFITANSCNIFPINQIKPFGQLPIPYFQ